MHLYRILLIVVISVPSTEESEQFKEQHDDVDVEDECANDVVVVAELVLLASRNQLGVVDQEQAVEEDQEAREDWMPPLREAHEKAD